MSPSPLTPTSDRRPLWMDTADRPATPPPPPPPPAAGPPEQPERPYRRGRRAPLAVLLVASAMLGGGTSAGVLAATGAFRDSATTSIQRTASDSGGLDAAALYAGTSAGVVDIKTGTGSGTGFVVDGDGHVVTAAHVVDGAASVTVTLQDGASRKATVLGTDDATDIAVIKIDASGLTLHPLELGSSASLDVGDEVAAIGDPFGYARSLSTGIVSGVDRTIKAPNGFTVAHAIQTDAAINPGNSGGPVLDADGKVVGIADQIATDGNADQSSGVGFAVPIDLVKSALKTLESGGRVRHAYLGVASADSSTETAGATVSGIVNGGPADDAGLRPGDIVTAFGGTAVADSTDLVAAIAAHQPGDKVEVTVKRGSGTEHATVTLGTQPARAGG
jgi:putative serine protease PepD